MEMDLLKHAGSPMNNGLRTSVNKPPEETKTEKKVVKEKGFFKSLWSKIVSKEEPRKVGEVVNQTSTNIARQFLTTTKEARLFESMAIVYGGVADPFSMFEVRDEASKQERFHVIQDEIFRNYLNNHQFLMEEYPQHRPDKAHKIKMTEAIVRELCLTQKREQEQQRLQRTQQDADREDKPKEVKDLTYYIKTLVKVNFEQMLNFSQKIPFAIRAMLKIILVRARGLDNLNSKIKPDNDEIKLIAQILIAGWLNQGYRNPKCFGIQPSVERELEMEYIFF